MAANAAGLDFSGYYKVFLMQRECMRRIKLSDLEILFDFWIEIPLYGYNRDHAIRFELHDRYPDNIDKLFGFFCDLYGDAFKNDNVVIIRQYDRCCKVGSISKLIGKQVKPMLRIDFTSKSDKDYYEQDRTSQIYVVKKDQINLQKIFNAIFYEKHDSELFFVDPETKTVLNMYDDRGIDIISKDRRILLQLYDKYSDWILEFNRDEIVNTLFGKKIADS
ncbi:MAG: DUF3885 domain-containing protein [Clostridiales bacterium]|nr:DUF3885 domain-containing protein [Clostridiales bacterium]